LGGLTPCAKGHPYRDPLGLTVTLSRGKVCFVITRVVITRRAEKQLSKTPEWIRDKLALWTREVELLGLEIVRKIPGYHDEPLFGERKGQRSIRLSRSYRAIYEIKRGEVAFVSIEEVNKHDY
jgi:toxin HigB-1